MAAGWRLVRVPAWGCCLVTAQRWEEWPLRKYQDTPETHVSVDAVRLLLQLEELEIPCTIIAGSFVAHRDPPTELQPLFGRRGMKRELKLLVRYCDQAPDVATMEKVWAWLAEGGQSV